MRIYGLYSCSFVLATIAATLLCASAAHAQDPSSGPLTIQPTVADHTAAQAATTRYRHALPANTPAALASSAQQTTERPPSHGGAAGGHADLLQYFGDVTDGGGHVVKFAAFHAIYLQPQTASRCTIPICWGNPEEFLRDLGRSDFIHVIDPYIGQFGGNRYTVGFNARVNYTPSATPLIDADIQAFVHSVAVQTGASGYGHIYNVFLPPGQDECFDSTLATCYSPGNLATFYFCAYHGSVDFPDVGHILYTVQPYSNVQYCQVQPGTLNGMLVDSTNNALNHETFETITDPDGDAWTNDKSSLLKGFEIADECQFSTLPEEVYNNVPTFPIGAHMYAVQLVYSNEKHACSSAP